MVIIREDERVREAVALTECLFVFGEAYDQHYERCSINIRIVPVVNTHLQS